MLYNTIKQYLLFCMTVILLASPVIAADNGNNKFDDKAQTVYVRHPLDFRPFSVFDYYWDNMFEHKLSTYIVN